MSIKSPAQLTAFTSSGEIDATNDLSVVWDNSAGLLKSIPVEGMLLSVGNLQATNHPTSVVLTTAESGQVIYNDGAIADVNYTLPAATNGYGYLLYNVTDYQIILIPAYGDIIVPGALGEYMYVSGKGYVGLVCTTNGFWNITYDAADYRIY